MKFKAIVSKLNPDQGTMVVITEDRQFISVDLPRDIPPLGSTIEIDIPTKIKKRGYKQTAWLAAAAVLLLAFTLSIFVGNVKPVAAYVNLDMKSRLQLTVDDEGKVKEVSALQVEDDKLINELKLKDKDIYQAVQDIVSKASDSGYFDSNSENLVMASITKLKDSQFVIDDGKIRDIIHKELSSHHYPGYIVVNYADKKYWDEAVKQGITVNQRMVTERAKEHGINIHEKELNHDFMKTIRDSDVSVQTLFPKESCEIKWQEPDTNPKPNLNQPDSNMDDMEILDHIRQYNNENYSNNTNYPSHEQGMNEKTNYTQYESEPKPNNYIPKEDNTIFDKQYEQHGDWSDSYSSDNNWTREGHGDYKEGMHR